MAPQERVEIRISRPPGYDDVHPDLVAEDAMREGWPYEVLQDEGADLLVAVDRVEGYERATKRELAADAIKATWQKYWRLA